MKPIFYLACLLLSWAASQAQGTSPSARPGKEPTGGLFETALKPSEVGDGWKRRIRLALDPTVNPSTYCPSKYDLPGMPSQPVDPVDPAAPFRKRLDQSGADAVIYLAYVPNTPVASLYVKILRFPTEKKAEEHWALRKELGESELQTIAGQEILATNPGKHLRPDLKAGMNTLECRAGQYVVRVAPARPGLGDPGLDWLLKQMEKIRRLSEPGGAAKQTQPSQSQAAQGFPVAGSGCPKPGRPGFFGEPGRPHLQVLFTGAGAGKTGLRGLRA